MTHKYYEIENKQELKNWFIELQRLRTQMFEVEQGDEDEVPREIRDHEMENLSLEENYILMKICELKGMNYGEMRN